MLILNLTFISIPAIFSEVKAEVENVYLPKIRKFQGVRDVKLYMVIGVGGETITDMDMRNLALHIECENKYEIGKLQQGLIEDIMSAHGCRFGENSMIFPTVLENV